MTRILFLSSWISLPTSLTGATSTTWTSNRRCGRRRAITKLRLRPEVDSCVDRAIEVTSASKPSHSSIERPILEIESHALAAQAAKILGVKSRTEAVHTELKENCGPQRIKKLMRKHAVGYRSQAGANSIVIFDTPAFNDHLRTVATNNELAGSSARCLSFLENSARNLVATVSFVA
jgi:hypothetical protein